MSPESALHLDIIHASPDWTTLSRNVERVSVSVIALQNKSLLTIRLLLLYTGDGNCLFNSLSIILFGKEDMAVHLRLSSVLHAVNHFNHYLAMVSACYVVPALSYNFAANKGST